MSSCRITDRCNQIPICVSNFRPISVPSISCGNTGNTGPTGSQGTPGYPGPSGTPGSTGPTGSQGTPGNPGPSGTPGATGRTGPTGPNGPQGNPGFMGPPGMPGMPGTNGAPGATGATGPTGQKGGTGATGGLYENYIYANKINDEIMNIPPYEETNVYLNTVVKKSVDMELIGGKVVIGNTGTYFISHRVVYSSYMTFANIKILFSALSINGTTYWGTTSVYTIMGKDVLDSVTANELSLIYSFNKGDTVGIVVYTSTGDIFIPISPSLLAASVNIQVASLAIHQIGP